MAENSEPNWFERHLNWTAVLTWIALYPIGYFTGVILNMVFIATNPMMDENTLFNVSLIISFMVSATWLLPTNGWILKKKNRSFWHLLWPFVPFGWIVFLMLENRSAQQEI